MGTCEAIYEVNESTTQRCSNQAAFHVSTNRGQSSRQLCPFHASEMLKQCQRDSVPVRLVNVAGEEQESGEPEYPAGQRQSKVFTLRMSADQWERLARMVDAASRHEEVAPNANAFILWRLGLVAQMPKTSRGRRIRLPRKPEIDA